jgi:serine/threonine-protein kinase RsbW
MTTAYVVPAVRSRTHVAADLTELVVVRDTLADALATCRWSEEDVFRVLICADEAMANALTHGSGAARAVEVRFRVDSDRVTLGIGQRCRSFVSLSPAPAPPADSSEHGRGLILMRALADSFRVWSRPGTTLVVLAFHQGSHRTQGEVQ